MSRIDLIDITKHYDSRRALDGISLTVPQGELLALVGPSGSGKTTTLRLIAALQEPTGGQILFDGLSVAGLSTRDRGAVVVFQDHALFPHLTVEENVGFGLKMRGMPSAQRKDRVEALLELVQLEGFGPRYPRQLSGGQQQRVAIARALAVEPRVLLLDEPFSSLDAGLKTAMRDFVRQLQRRLGITCIFVTHDIQDALMTADRIAVLFDGVLEQTGSPRELYRNPVSRRTADFFGPAGYERVTLAGGVVRSVFGPLAAPAAAEGTADLMLRPECIAFAGNGEGGLRGRIADAVFCGGQTRYAVETEIGLLHLTAAGDLPHAAGETVALTLTARELCLFHPESGVRL